MSGRNFARSAPAAHFVPQAPASLPKRPKVDPPRMDLPPSYQNASIFDNPEALAALTGKVPGAEGAMSYVDPSILQVPSTGTRPIIMGGTQAPGTGNKPIPAPAHPSNKVLARSLTNNTPSFIAAASCPNPDLLSQLNASRSGLAPAGHAAAPSTAAASAAEGNAETIRKAQNMSMGRSPTIFSIMSGLDTKLADMSLGSSTAPSGTSALGKEGGAPQQFSSRARGSMLLPPPPGVAEEAEEDEDEDEDEDAEAEDGAGDDDELPFGM